jgi:hypothetical protein
MAFHGFARVVLDYTLPLTIVVYMPGHVHLHNEKSANARIEKNSETLAPIYYGLCKPFASRLFTGGAVYLLAGILSQILKNV